MTTNNPSITRRDFLDGVAVSLAATAVAPAMGMSRSPGGATSRVTESYYPPTLTGMRGSHAGSFEVAHALVMQGKRPDTYQRVDGDYDLVIVGGGISGLAAAYLYRKKMGAAAKILILDNHDDFGGHAKRNEFHAGDRMLLGFGGSINLEQASMSATAHGLLEEIGVEFKALQDAGAADYALSNAGAPYGIYLGREEYGKNQIVPGLWGEIWAGGEDYRAMINALNLPARDKAGYISLVGGEKNYLADMPLPDREKYLTGTSYLTFLTERVGLSGKGAQVVEPWMRAYFGVGLGSVSVMEAITAGCPGLYAVGLPDEVTRPDVATDPDAYRFPMFPDGNASVARLFVRHLIPAVAPGNSMQDLITARFDYSRLDEEDSPVRLRLNSTAVHVANHGDDAVNVDYVSGGNAFRVRGRNCILAGYNGMIPHLCPELPEVQKKNLAYGSKVPFVWVNVVLKTGRAVRKGGTSVYHCPGSFFELVSHAPPVTLGDYAAPTRQDDPMVLFLAHMPAPAAVDGQSARDICRLGRHKLLVTPFAEFEAALRKQLTQMFGDYGFDGSRDIEAITVNRWSHGYAYGYMNLHDPVWEAGQAPHELGRKRLGRISIANSDAEASAYVHGAIDAAARAVGEVTASA